MRELSGWAVLMALVGSGCGGPVTSGADGGRDGEVERPDATTDTGAPELCVRDLECTDSNYCNGLERCLPGEPGAAPNGCLAGAPPCSEMEICNESAGRCEADDCADGGDRDGDGDRRPSCGGHDCDDDDRRVSSTRSEACDDLGIDEDCDPSTIYNDRPSFNDGDRDGDGFVDHRCFNLRADGTENRGDDCDDSRPSVSPVGVEACNGRDDDCNGAIDDGVTSTFYRDFDGDGYGTVAETDTGCTAPVGYVTTAGDCDDAVASVNPAATDRCNGIDDDCDGTPDNPAFPAVCACEDGRSQPCGPSTDEGRCAIGTSTCVAGRWSDCAGAVSPTTEICNGEDEDCDGLIDEGLLNTYYRDSDGDGSGDASESVTACFAAGGYVTSAGDCDDANGAIHPSARDACNGIDDNCDGVIDPGCSCIDGTSRGCGIAVGECTAGTQVCAFGAWGTCSGRSAGTEVCNGLDDDCDGATDEDLLRTYYEDSDGDGFGSAAVTVMACVAPVGYTGVSGDCNDASGAVRPGMPEVCNGIDDNCDGVIDPGCSCVNGTSRACGIAVGECTAGTQVCAFGAWGTCSGRSAGTEVCNGLDDDCDGATDEDLLNTYYQDSDGDGFGSDAVTATACVVPVGYAGVSGDCNDLSGAVRPGMPEQCNGVDDNCDGVIDPPECSCVDGTRRACGTDVGVCTAGTETCSFGEWGVCSGRSAGIEACNGLDDDCDGVTDEDLLNTYYRDADGDGFGNVAISTMACTAPAGYTGVSGDCNDASGAARPGMPELCNGFDDNCDGVIDPGCACIDGSSRACGTDVGECTVGTQICAFGAWGACSGRPAATEVCNSLDDDCDGVTDEGLLTRYWRDVDVDGYGNPTTGIWACSTPVGYVGNWEDCDDSNTHRSPGRNEDLYPCDGIDNDCDSIVDETQNPATAVGRLTCYRDQDGDTYGVSGTTTRACSCTGGWAGRAGDCVDGLGARAALVHPGAGFQREGHCNGYAVDCTTGSGRPGCSEWTGSFWLCVAASWDYDCDGATTRQAPACRLVDVGGGLRVCLGDRSPTTTHTTTPCGSLVAHGDCCLGSCAPSCSVSNEPLACR